MSLITVTALKAFDYRGRPVLQGTSVEVQPVEALALARQGCINLSHRSRRIETADIAPDPIAEPTRRHPINPSPEEDPALPRRRYRRRDLEAEP